MGNEVMSAGQLLKQANRLKRAGKLDEAIALYHRVIKINPNFAWAYNNLGDAFVKQGKLGEAVVEYQKAIDINPNLAWFYYQLGEVFAQQGKLELASTYFHKSTDTNPNLLDLLIHVNYSQFTINRHESLLYLFDNKDRDYLQDEPKWISFAVKPNVTYSLEGKVSSESFPSSKSALVQCEFFDNKGEVLPPPYTGFVISETVGLYKYIPVNNNDLSAFSIAFTPPGEAVSARMGFRKWNSKNPIVIASLIKIYCSTLIPKKPSSHFASMADAFGEALYLQIKQKKHDFQQPPFFIIGSGRCGTTLMRRILQSHPKVIVTDENYTISKSLNTFERSIPWSEKVEAIFAELCSQNNYQHLNLSPLVKCVSKLESKEQKLDNLWNCFHWFYSKIYKKKATVWGDKTPLNIFHPEKIISIFPDAKFVCLLRNAYDVCASWSSFKGYYGRYEGGLNRWIKSNKCIFNFILHYPSSVCFVKYEDLVTNPYAEVERVCQFLSLDFQASMINNVETAERMTDVLLLEHLKNVTKEISTNRIGQGIKIIPEKIKQEIDKRAKIWHDIFGYSF